MHSWAFDKLYFWLGPSYLYLSVGMPPTSMKWELDNNDKQNHYRHTISSPPPGVFPRPGNNGSPGTHYTHPWQRTWDPDWTLFTDKQESSWNLFIQCEIIAKLFEGRKTDEPRCGMWVDGWYWWHTNTNNTGPVTCSPGYRHRALSSQSELVTRGGGGTEGLCHNDLCGGCEKTRLIYHDCYHHQIHHG